MISKKWSLALIALMLAAPLSASALGISIVNVSSTGASTTSLENGDRITFDLLVENSTSELVFGLGLGVYGYDEGAPGNVGDNRLRFAGGTNAPAIFSQVFSAGSPNTSFGGLEAVGPVRENGASFPISDPRRVQLFNAASLSGTTGTGSDDVGINGLQTNGADVHLQVTFAVVAPGAAPGDITLEFGTGQFGDAVVGDGGSILDFNNTSYTLTIIPEPGTALLMGLGLAGLAANRRR